MKHRLLEIPSFLFPIGIISLWAPHCWNHPTEAVYFMNPHQALPWLSAKIGRYHFVAVLYLCGASFSYFLAIIEHGNSI